MLVLEVGLVRRAILRGSFFLTPPAWHACAALLALFAACPTSAAPGRGADKAAPSPAPPVNPVRLAVGAGATNGAGAATKAARAPATAAIADKYLERAGRKETRANFKGAGRASLIVYGRFRANFAAGPNLLVKDYIDPVRRGVTIAKGDYGVVILPDTPKEKPILFATGEAEFAQIAPRQAATPDGCWKPSARHEGLYIGREDAAGVLYYKSGWKWSQCGD